MFFFKKYVLLFILFLISTEGIFTSYQISGIGIVRIFEAVFFMFIFKSFIKDVNENKILQLTVYFILFLFLFLSLKLFTTTFIFNQVDLSIFVDAVRLIFMMIYLYIVYYALSKNIKNINIILILNLPILLIAFFQSSITPFTDIAWNIKFNYFGASSIKYANTPWFRSRVIGLYGFSIPLAYILTTNMILTTYLYIKSKSNIYIGYFIFLGVIAIFSLTRSVVLAWGILLLYLFYKSLNKGTVLKKFISVLFIVSTLLYPISIYSENASKLNRITNISGSSAEGRVPLALTASYALVKYPFGFSKNEYEIVRHEMYKILKNKNILIFAPHNGFLNIGFKYTTFGLLAFILYIFYLRKIINNTLSSEMKIFFSIVALSYLANALFHNNFIFYQDFYGLILLAILAYEYNNSKSGKGINEN